MHHPFQVSMLLLGYYVSFQSSVFESRGLLHDFWTRKFPPQKKAQIPVSTSATDHE